MRVFIIVNLLFLVDHKRIGIEQFLKESNYFAEEIGFPIHRFFCLFFLWIMPFSCFSTVLVLNVNLRFVRERNSILFIFVPDMKNQPIWQIAIRCFCPPDAHPENRNLSV